MSDKGFNAIEGRWIGEDANALEKIDLELRGHFARGEWMGLSPSEFLATYEKAEKDAKPAAAAPDWSAYLASSGGRFDIARANEVARRKK